MCSTQRFSFTDDFGHFGTGKGHFFSIDFGKGYGSKSFAGNDLIDRVDVVGFAHIDQNRLSGAGKIKSGTLGGSEMSP